jgi:hypothetical protein
MVRSGWIVGCGVAIACAAPPARAQLNVGANAGTVRYEQVATTSSLALNPDFTLTGARSLLNLTGTATTESGGGSSIEAGGTVWGATKPVLGHLQLDAMLQGSYTNPRYDSTSYSGIAFGEVAWAGDSYGLAVGAGGMRGGIAGQPALNAVRGGVRGWFAPGDVTLTLAVQPTALSTRVWFTDVTASAEVDPGHAEITGTALLRQSPATGLDLGGEAEVVYHLTPRVAIAASGGRYLRDPFQGLPQGVHLTVGAVLTLWQPRAADQEGVGQADLSDLELKALGINPHGMGNSTVRSNPSTSKGLGGSGGSSFGRGHKL